MRRQIAAGLKASGIDIRTIVAATGLDECVVESL